MWLRVFCLFSVSLLLPWQQRLSSFSHWSMLRSTASPYIPRQAWDHQQTSVSFPSLSSDTKVILHLLKAFDWHCLHFWYVLWLCVISLILQCSVFFFCHAFMTFSIATWNQSENFYINGPNMDLFIILSLLSLFRIKWNTRRIICLHI